MKKDILIRLWGKLCNRSECEGLEKITWGGFKNFHHL